MKSVLPSLFFEADEAAGLAWHPSEKHKGWDWDWFINPGFLMAYDHDGRRKLIDVAFARFKAEFGTWPKSVGSWLLDAWSMDYMANTYGVDGFCICREQDSTDAYGLRGGYSNGAYYPSRKNMLSAAVDMKNAVHAPVFKMLTPDPIYNYGIPHKLYPGYPHQRGCPTMEPVWYGGNSPKIVDWYFRVYTGSKGLLNLSYMQTGQENSFGSERILPGLRMQFEKLREKSAKGEIEILYLSESGEWFKNRYALTPPSSVCCDSDNTEAGNKTAWYSCRNYRADFHYRNKMLYIRDLYIYDDRYKERYLEKKDDGHNCSYFNLPVTDGYRFSRNGLRAGIYPCIDKRKIEFEGEYASKVNGEKSLEVAAGDKIIYRASEEEITIECKHDGWYLVFEYDEKAAERYVGYEGRTLSMCSGRYE